MSSLLIRLLHSFIVHKGVRRRTLGHWPPRAEDAKTITIAIGHGSSMSSTWRLKQAAQETCEFFFRDRPQVPVRRDDLWRFASRSTLPPVDFRVADAVDAGADGLRERPEEKIFMSNPEYWHEAVIAHRRFHHLRSSRASSLWGSARGIRE
jgi:hypothetical protein